MKKLIAYIILTLNASITLANSDFEAKFGEVVSLEKQGRILEAALESAYNSIELLNGARVNEIVETINNSFTENRNEIVTENKSNGFSFRILLGGLLNGGMSRSWDIAKIVTTNPVELAEFDRKTRNDYAVLKVKVREYIIENESALIYAKAFALKALILSSSLNANERIKILPLVKSTVQYSQKLQFFGNQNIIKCVQTNYADRLDSTTMGLGGLLFSFTTGEENKRNAYSETLCKNQSGPLVSVSEEVLASARLNKIDLIIGSLLAELGLSEAIDVHAEPYETWGSPNFESLENN